MVELVDEHVPEAMAKHTLDKELRILEFRIHYELIHFVVRLSGFADLEITDSSEKHSGSRLSL